ncbi:MAG: chromosome segregation protein SMC, partial [Actinobacteria bacterium]|nr:chromosome segregation protein SMC [Actinomycetota bacterium]
MYLKSLTLRGFKSFADKTTLKFEPGVTAIVGPNGSGKSNVTDAVLWVLGEQSPRSLRGGSMEDVIFAGSATRQALGVAEVVLTLDNSDGALPIEFSEVTIARRVYRTGESEYYINNSACRLLDIQELLSGSGLGRGFYSIIGQGRIEEALTAKPEERRVFIEEAAGVLKHKRRRDRAVKRLSSMDANLIRVKDILSEVNRQLAPLKRQAELARNHAELTEELKRHELSIAVLDLKELQVKWASLEADTATAKQYIKGHESDLARIESELESTELNLEAAESRVSDLSEKRHRIESAGERLRAVASLVAEKARNAAERLETLSAGSYRAATRKLVLEKQAQQSMRELDQVDLAISKGDERLAAAESDFERTVEKARGLKSRLNDLEAAIGADERAVGNYETAVANLDLAIKTGEAQLEILREQRSSVEARHLKVGADLKEALGSEESLVVQVAELESKLSGLEVEKRRAEANLAASREDLSRAEKDNESCLARMKTLEETIEDGDPDASTAFKAGGEDAIAILGESISVPKKYEKAIEAVLGGDFYCLVVKETDAVRKLASLVDDRLSILSLDRAEPKRSAKEGLVSAASIIECLATVRPAVDALLDGVYVAADLEMALAVEGGESTIVTLDGEVVHPTGKVVLGTKSDLLGQLARRREIGELGGMLARMSKTVAKIKSCCEELSASLKSLEEAALSVSRDLEARRAEMNAAHQRIESVKREVDAVAQELKVIDDRAATFTSRLEVEAHKLEENRMRLVKLRASLEERRAEMGAVRTSREECLKEEAEASLKVSKAKVELDALVGRRRGVERAYGEALNELAEIKSTIDR